MTDEILTRQDLKELLGIKNLRLQSLIAQGLPFIKINSERGTYVFLKSSVISWLKELESPKPIKEVPATEVKQPVKLASPSR